jgi:pseudaminic acid synthase
MTKIIADISGNHGGDLQKALDLIKAAADCGCDYAKFQYYCPFLMPDQENRKLYDKLRVPRSWLDYLFMVAGARQIPLFASVFDIWGVEELRKWRPPFFKIAAPESTRLTNYKEIVGAIPRATPIIFSTGSLDHPFDGMIANSDILLWCPPGHPAKIASYSYEYDGISDHCADLTNSIMAIEDGAKWIERHIKLYDDCVDWEFSSNPEQMTALCKLAHQS